MLKFHKSKIKKLFNNTLFIERNQERNTLTNFVSQLSISEYQIFIHIILITVAAFKSHS